MPAVEPDEFDLKLISDALEVNDGTVVSIEELSAQLGIDYDSL